MKRIVKIVLPIILLGIAPFVSAENQNKRLPLEDVQRFTTVISQIKKYYVKSVEDKDLFEDAIRGMLKGLDPHSGYLDVEDYKDLHASTKGEFGGLGIEVTMENGLIKIISPIDDTPAAKAGLRSGDYIVRLNNKPVRGMTLRDAVTQMRGKSGTDVEITVLRKGEKKPLSFKLTREVIHIKSVKSKVLDDRYGYIRISHFQSSTKRDMQKAINRLNQKVGGHIDGLILDLRNNPGGLLDSAIAISDSFIDNKDRDPKRLIVFTKGRIPGAEYKAVATPGDILKTAPIVVLINGGSASGSEIVAGALQDNNRAVILGTKSFGKGSVQTVLPLDDKRGIKLTTALYFTPNGRSIQAKGVMPDITVESLKVPEKAKKDNFTSFFEADLSGHLENGNSKQAKKAAKKAKSLVHEDYQLHQALNLLKGLVLAHK